MAVKLNKRFESGTSKRKKSCGEQNVVTYHIHIFWYETMSTLY